MEEEYIVTLLFVGMWVGGTINNKFFISKHVYLLDIVTTKVSKGIP